MVGFGTGCGWCRTGRGYSYGDPDACIGVEWDLKRMKLHCTDKQDYDRLRFGRGVLFTTYNFLRGKQSPKRGKNNT